MDGKIEQRWLEANFPNGMEKRYSADSEECPKLEKHIGTIKKLRVGMVLINAELTRVLDLQPRLQESTAANPS